LDYGFAKCTVYRDAGEDFLLREVSVAKGQEKTVSVALKSAFSYVFTGGEDLSAVKKEVILEKTIKAPLTKGQKVGEYRYSLGGTVLGSVDIICTEEMREMTFSSSFKRCKDLFFRAKEAGREEKLSLTPSEK
jgi:D-alanyl-D-alanine carboxypeptidase (penicillin-binding protein 5/6)